MHIIPPGKLQLCVYASGLKENTVQYIRDLVNRGLIRGVNIGSACAGALKHGSRRIANAICDICLISVSTSYRPILVDAGITTSSCSPGF